MNMGIRGAYVVFFNVQYAALVAEAMAGSVEEISEVRSEWDDCLDPELETGLRELVAEIRLYNQDNHTKITSKRIEIRIHTPHDFNIKKSSFHVLYFTTPLGTVL
ncbi:hypothetical protein ACJX0J_029143, partial [Zea mays]